MYTVSQNITYTLIFKESGVFMCHIALLVTEFEKIPTAFRN